MNLLKKEGKLMVQLNPDFQRALFQRLIDNPRGSLRAGDLLKIPASSIREYKNLCFKSVPRNLVNMLIE